MKIETKLEKIYHALIKKDDIEKIEYEAKDHPFLDSRIRIFYKNGEVEILRFDYYSSPTEFIKNYNNYRARKEVENDDKSKT